MPPAQDNLALPIRQRPTPAAGISAVAALAFPHPPVRSLYIHTPFCSHKCHYCDFYSFVDTRDQQAAFVDRLIEELANLAPHSSHSHGQPLRSIFVGGGTPSLLRLELWERLLDALAPWIPPPDETGGQGTAKPGSVDAGSAIAPFEFTVECNPESASRELLDLLASRGVNRISLGAQSFNPRHLKSLERTHNPENIPRALEAARAAGIPRQSIDLIFAIPGQTIDEWADDLRRAVALGTTHLSCYNLTYEANTAMTHRLHAGEFDPIDEQTEAAMSELTVATLRTSGLERYEVSNFARPGHESVHNLAYWKQEQWLAAGPSASGHVYGGPDMRAGSARWKNVPRLGDYLASKGASPITDFEPPDPARLIRERIMMGLRLAEGLDAGSLLNDLRAIAPAAEAPLLAAAQRFESRGHLTLQPDRWILSDSGFLLCDLIAGELMGVIGRHEGV